MQLVLTIVSIVLLLLGLPVLILVARDRIAKARRQRRDTPEALAAARQAIEARLTQPDWGFYEKHLQRPAPDALRALYADHALIRSVLIDYGETETINTFEPLDAQGLIDSTSWLGFDIAPIATNDFGDPIYLRPGKNQSNAVFVTYHDGGDTVELAPDVASFLERIRYVTGSAK